MNNKVLYKCLSGLGDKLLSILGIYIICKYLKYELNILFNHENTIQLWGSNYYDIRLFNFEDITLLDGVDCSEGYDCDFYAETPYFGASVNPYEVYKFIHNILKDVTFEEISDSYSIFIKKIIKPSDIILKRIPVGIENAYGIHLRKTDKIFINNNNDYGINNSFEEFQIIVENMFEKIKNIVIEEDDPTFIIVGEDEAWNLEFRNRLLNDCIICDKIKILDIDYSDSEKYPGFSSVLDMFCLSKCKTIIQGVKYTGFSLTASLLGTGDLINFSYCSDKGHHSFIQLWLSAISVNGKKNCDLDFYKKFVGIPNIITNISKLWSGGEVIDSMLTDVVSTKLVDGSSTSSTAAAASSTASTSLDNSRPIQIENSFQLCNFALLNSMNDPDFIKKNNVKIYLDSDKVAVIIDPRFDDLMEAVIRNFMYFMNPLGWNLLIVGYSKYKSIIKEKFPHCIFYPIVDENIYFDSENKPNISIDTYNSILMNVEFWKMIPYKNIAIFQKDCIMFRMFPDYFYQEYSFSGANYYRPTDISFYYGGINGGFSIRNRDVMIECLEKITWDDIYKYRKSVLDRLPRGLIQEIGVVTKNMHEDIYFTHACEMLFKNVPDFFHRKFLAIEADFSFQTCVFHGWNKQFVVMEDMIRLLTNSELFGKYFSIR
jgi:hypothetical protein